MLTLASLLIVSIMTFQAGTVVDLGLVERDLTGDGAPETLRLVGVRRSAESLAVTLTIESGGRTIYRFALAPLTRTVGLDAGRQVAPADGSRARVAAFKRWFFADEKFQRPAEFVQRLRDMAPARVQEIPEVIARDRQPSDTTTGGAIWQELLESPITIFTFSPGGDALVAIGWSARANRFYRLVDCC